MASVLVAPPRGSPKKIKIVIIGAGVAGLGAAVKILSTQSLKDCPAEFEVRVLEATERSGGRCCTVDFGAIPVETGATYFHGSVGNAMLDLGKKCGIACKPVTEEDETLFCSDHGPLRPDELALYEKCSELFESILDALGSKDWEGKRGDVYEYFKTAFDEKCQLLLKSPHDSSEHAAFVRSVFRYFVLVQGMSESVLNCKGVDISGQWIYDNLEGEELSRCEEGSSLKQIIASMETEVIASKRGFVHFGSWVNKIRWPCNDQVGFNGHHVLVECSNGELFEADHVIVTLSLGALKRWAVNEKSYDVDSFFVPELSMQKTEAIRNIGFGLLNKVVLRFQDEPVLEESKSTTIFIWSEDSTLERLSEVYPWISSFCALERLGSSNLYETYFAGRDASLVALAKDEQIARGLQAALKLFLHKDVQLPAVVFKSNWEGEPHFGSYSYNGPETDTVHRETLSEPLCVGGLRKPAVLFAGEATHPSRWSSLDGALETGRREADRIIEFWTKSAPLS